MMSISSSWLSIVISEMSPFDKVDPSAALSKGDISPCIFDHTGQSCISDLLIVTRPFPADCLYESQSEWSLRTDWTLTMEHQA